MKNRKLAIALGDPNGIGPEIVLKALDALTKRAAAHGNATPSFKIFGPASVLEKAADGLGLRALCVNHEIVNVGDMPTADAIPGAINKTAGLATVMSAAAAIQACRMGEVSAVIAAPHHETAIALAGIEFSGYPSLVAKVCGLPEEKVFLMLVGGGLRIVHATLHESVRTALARISPKLVIDATVAGVKACTQLGVLNPKIGIFGVNPHASEGGLFGTEDAELVAPAALALRESGLQIEGPTGADLLLSQRACDLYVAMFHDQGHIPIKLLAPNAASALSIGADALLSSVGHGCAMDIAGRGVADATAMIRTIDMLS
jgi:1,2-dihydroxy-3,5-cyclohexadiene-1,4-dicarboxylate dehydrogenase